MNLIDALKETGRARKPGWEQDTFVTFLYFQWILFEGNPADEQNVGRQVEYKAQEIMANDWEPYRELCKHEPRTSMALAVDACHPLRYSYVFTCNLCGAELKPTAWEEV